MKDAGAPDSEQSVMRRLGRANSGWCAGGTAV